MNDQPTMKSPRIMFGYAAFLVTCGLVAFGMANFDWARAKTAVIVSAGTGLLMLICGIMARKISTNRVAGMIGIHAGLALPLVFAIMFGFRAAKTFNSGGEAKRYLALILSAMAIGSLIAFVGILLTRSKAVDR